MWFPNSVTLAHKISKDEYHNITYGTGTTTTCRYQEIIKTVTDRSGNEVIASTWLMFPAFTIIGYDDKITLPDGSTPPIVSIQRINNVAGIEVSVEVYLANSHGSLL